MEFKPEDISVAYISEICFRCKSKIRMYEDLYESGRITRDELDYAIKMHLTIAFELINHIKDKYNSIVDLSSLLLHEWRELNDT